MQYFILSIKYGLRQFVSLGTQRQLVTKSASSLKVSKVDSNRNITIFFKFFFSSYLWTKSRYVLVKSHYSFKATLGKFL